MQIQVFSDNHVSGNTLDAEPYHQQAESNGRNNVADKLPPFTLLYHSETIMAEGGECSEATTETGDKESIDQRAHIVASPKTNENTDDKTADHIDRKSADGIIVAAQLLAGNAGQITSAGTGKTAQPRDKHIFENHSSLYFKGLSILSFSSRFTDACSAERHHSDTEHEAGDHIEGEHTALARLKERHTLVRKRRESSQTAAETCDPQKVFILSQTARLIEVTIQHTDDQTPDHIGHIRAQREREGTDSRSQLLLKETETGA